MLGNEPLGGVPDPGVIEDMDEAKGHGVKPTQDFLYKGNSLGLSHKPQNRKRCVGQGTMSPEFHLAVLLWTLGSIPETRRACKKQGGVSTP